MTRQVLLVSRRRRKRIPALHGLEPTYLDSPAAVARASQDQASERPLWIVPDRQGLIQILDAVTAHRPRRRLGALLVLQETAGSDLLLFSSVAPFFAHAVVQPPVLLAPEELVDVLQAERPEDYCIGGVSIPERRILVLVRGDLSTLVARFEDFPVPEGGPEPDFDQFGVQDFGQVLRFGTYESTFDAVLYLHDPEYRARLRVQRTAADQTLGGSLRRLRLQRGLRQSDFGDIPSKTIARIERGEVTRPQRGTLRRIADRLGVASQQLGTF